MRVFVAALILGFVAVSVRAGAPIVPPVLPPGAPASASARPQAFSYDVPIATDINTQVLLYTTQGLLNRAKATLWFISEVFWTFPSSSRWFMENYLSTTKGISFSSLPNGSSFCDLFSATNASSVVRGLALYDDAKLDASRWMAVTSSGLDDLLPVTAAMLADPSVGACLRPLPVVVDYSNTAFASDLDAFAWAAATLQPRCARDAVYSAGHTYTDATGNTSLGGDPAIDIGIDGAVASRLFVFNLSPNSGVYPAQAALFVSIVNQSRTSATSVPSLYGWAEPEPEMTLATSLGGGAVVCDGAPNLSFWARVASGVPSLPYNIRSVPFHSDAIYMAWQTNEGDTPKIAAALQAGLWIDPARGSVPMSWGINPLLADFAPGLLEFYALSASSNDTFFAATAGGGYAYPSKMPAAAFTTYVTRVRELIKAITPTWPPYSMEVDIWDTNSAENISSYAAIAGDAIGMFSMQPEAMAGTNTVLPGALPLVITNATLWYPLSSGPCPADPLAHFVDAIAATVARIPTRPVFLLAYGIEYDVCGNSMFHYASKVQEAMGAGNATAGLPPLTVVGMQDMVRLARTAAAA